MNRSYYESSARARIAGLLDAGSFDEWLPAAERLTSPHLATLEQPAAFDDGVIIGRGSIAGKPVFIAAQEGGFMGGAVGEVHGAKIVGVLERAVRDRPAAVLMLVESGGVRLQEANAGLIAVSEVMRAILAARAAGVPVIVAIGGQYGCFGGMGIASRCATTIIISEEGRLGLSGPEVIETVRGVEEYDSRDRALVWRTVGGKHRNLLGECDTIVADSMEAFRDAIIASMENGDDWSLAALEREHRLLADRVQRFGACRDGRDIWLKLGWPDPDAIAMMDNDEFMAAAQGHRAK
ncbi:MAG TPA: biotin-independent malonate decarboxylase subunit beta [Rhodanobacter sp.]|nr:biotin-independent malonate decarboxylase subunit beta [Rhodanobacter sp.]